MSWKLGKKLKEGALGQRSPSTSIPIDRSATPTPATMAAGGIPPSIGTPSSMPSSSAQNPLASSTGAPITRSGLLTIRVVDARGLNLPPGTVTPAAIARALAANGGGGASSLVQSFTQPGGAASGAGAGGVAAGHHHPGAGGGAGNRQSMQRKQCWWLPYLVLEFDKNEVLIDALGGDLSSPVWMFKATFDVSRNSEISLQTYLRSGDGPRGSQSANGGAGAGDAQKDGQGDDVMGVGDIFLGGVKFVPDFENQRTTDDWYPVSGGTGQIHVQVSYSKSQGTSLNMEAFDLLKVIGKGSFGKVMQVRKRDTSRIYALKTIRKAHIVSRSEVTHTLAERTVLAQVNSPFIVPLKFSFQSPDKLYLVLAFVNGGELFHHLQREGRFSEERARFYAAELLCALEHLHGFNVIYRDLKPENILLDYTGHIALCDFGLCKLNMGDQETTNTFCGTPEYLAPELLLGHGYTRSVDWWTLGVLLYEMITGLPPFYSEDVNEMYRRILADPLKWPPEVGPDARSLLTLLLERDPSKRLGSGPNGAQDIKSHPFFAKHIDWSKLLRKQITPPFKPAVKSAIDVSNFDPEFTSENPVDSVVDSHLSATIQQQFVGFSYNGEQRMDEAGSFRG